MVLYANTNTVLVKVLWVIVDELREDWEMNCHVTFPYSPLVSNKVIVRIN